MPDDKPAKTRWVKARSILFNVLLLGAVFVAGLAFQTRNMLPTDHEAAPGLSAITLSGSAYDLGDAAGRPALVYFFAPWCRICGASADNLARLRRWRDTEDLEIIAVALDWESAEDVRSYAERHEFTIPVVLADSRTRAQWQIFAYPSYYVLDSQHRIVRRDVGYSSQFGLWWRAWTVD